MPIAGTRVTFVRAVDRYPHARVEIGERGTVAEALTDGQGRTTMIAVTLDRHVPGLDEWDNAILWDREMENLDDFFQDCTEDPQ